MNIDKNRLRQQLDNIAKNTVKVVSASSLKLLALNVHNAVKEVVQAAVKQEYDDMSNRLEGEELSKFLDLSNGYMVSMSRWINKTPIRFPRIPVMEEPDEKNATNGMLQDIVKRKEVLTFGMGTALSIILFFSGMKIVALVTEAIATSASIYLYKQGEEQTREINEHAKATFEKEVNAYVNQVIDSALNWVVSAEQKSGSLTSTFI